MECRRHQGQNNQQGVCPTCLRERLSRLPYTQNTASFIVAPSGFSSKRSSSSPSPKHYRSVSELTGSASFVMGKRGDHKSNVIDETFIGGDYGLMKKCRSLAFVPMDRDRDSKNRNSKEKKKKRKNQGLWSKLILFKGKIEKEGFVHSRAAV